MKRIIWGLLLVFILTACSDRKEEVDSEKGNVNEIIYYEDGKTILYEGEVKDGEPHGKGVQYHRNSEVKFEGLFKDGEIYEGIAYRGGKLYYEGKFKDEKPFQDGIRSQDELRAETDKKNKLHKLKTMNPKIGMTQEEVLASSWGKPKDINKTTTAYGTSEQWVYSNYNYLYFDDGILTSIQN